MRLAWWVLVAGCGRINFAPIENDATNATIDALDGDCPAGFAHMTGNPALGTSDFCVMLTEARAWNDTNGDSVVVESELDADGCFTPTCDSDWTLGTFRPVSILPVTAEPWRAVSAVVAQTACASLGPRYDLLANREWMTIARNAELDARNWFDKIVGNVRVVQGHVDGTGTSAILDPVDPYTGTGNAETDPPGAGWEERRTLVAFDRNIWDLSGSHQEWVDWTIGPPLDGAPTPCAGAELPAFSCTGIAPADFQSSTGTYDSSVGVGTIIGGSGNATRRGGQGSDLAFGYAGIYGLNMNRAQTDLFAGTSFRCVYRL